MVNPQAYLVPEDQSHYAADKLHYEADPQDVHKLENKIQRFIRGVKGRLREIHTCAKIKHNKVGVQPDGALLSLLENTGCCSERLDSRD